LPQLQECLDGNADLTIPAADYLLTLDADSLVLPDYALKLVPIMEQNARIGVIQTPYSAIPGSMTTLERIAGATTDVQHIVHQGFTYFNATYWVGANALLRVAALRDIEEVRWEGGHPISVFIQDRTVIEDTGSTIDLVRRGWTLHNYPERLAYSATPSDFGALIIQRRRWANGGLIILGDLIRYIGTRNKAAKLSELLMRAHYLCSPAIGTGCLLALMLLPFDTSLASAWLPVTALPYYFLYGRDLRQLNYSWGDLLRVYALNLMLIPVTLAGVLASIVQLATGRKSAFGRTPKIEDRTPVPRGHALAQLSLLAYLATCMVVDTVSSRYDHALFSAFNASMLAYGISFFIGWRDTLVSAGLARLLSWCTSVVASLGAPMGRPAPSRQPQVTLPDFLKRAG
jgi:cellulose synthase/poly-beta-1,6-N-acetylglucosamine synthase-like glycosyltransferase